MENKSYRFALIADIDLDLERNGENTYFIYAEENFRQILKAAKDHGCEFIISAGDQVTNATGAVKEWQRYREIIRDSGYQGLIFEALGNHELRYAKYGGCSVRECVDEFIQYTELSEKPVIRENGKPYYEYIHPLFGDSYLFMAIENGYDVNSLDNFSDEQMDWAESAIAKGPHRGGGSS